MTRDDIRVETIRRALDEAGLDALVCALPHNVLLLSGYWPLAGAALAVATREGRTALIAPSDEMEIAERALSDEVRKYQVPTLEALAPASDPLWLPLREVAADLSIEKGRIGYERGPWFVPASYMSMRLYGAGMVDLLRGSLPDARLRPADKLLASLRATPTPRELERVRAVCRMVGQAFLEGALLLREGMKEYEAAALFRAPLVRPPMRQSTQGAQSESRRSDGFTSCLSGPNSANAGDAYGRSRDRALAAGDFVTINCDAYIDGYWAEVARTFVMGEAGPRKLEMYGAVHAASRAAMDVIRPGAKAADVDAAAREALASRGFDEAANPGVRRAANHGGKHGLGHAVGFAAADPDTPPRLRPASDDKLEAGMIFSLEPSIYIEGYGGLRHCDMALVTESGVEILTPFQSGIEHLVVRSSSGGGGRGLEVAVSPAAMA
jgi:Xaa-Pro aminopeptidase